MKKNEQKTETEILSTAEEHVRKMLNEYIRTRNTTDASEEQTTTTAYVVTAMHQGIKYLKYKKIKATKTE